MKRCGSWGNVNCNCVYEGDTCPKCGSIQFVDIEDLDKSDFFDKKLEKFRQKRCRDCGFGYKGNVLCPKCGSANFIEYIPEMEYALDLKYTFKKWFNVGALVRSSIGSVYLWVLFICIISGMLDSTEVFFTVSACFVGLIILSDLFGIISILINAPLRKFLKGFIIFKLKTLMFFPIALIFIFSLPLLIIFRVPTFRMFKLVFCESRHCWTVIADGEKIGVTKDDVQDQINMIKYHDSEGNYYYEKIGLVEVWL